MPALYSIVLTPAIHQHKSRPQAYLHVPSITWIIIKKLENTVAQKEKLIQITLEPPSGDKYC